MVRRVLPPTARLVQWYVGVGQGVERVGVRDGWGGGVVGQGGWEVHRLHHGYAQLQRYDGVWGGVGLGWGGTGWVRSARGRQGLRGRHLEWGRVVWGLGCKVGWGLAGWGGEGMGIEAAAMGATATGADGYADRGSSEGKVRVGAGPGAGADARRGWGLELGPGVGAGVEEGTMINARQWQNPQR